MPWELRDDRPIYTQLLEQLQLRIIAGAYQAGQRLPSVRDLAQEASVNANTMQRALSELEQAGLVFAQRTAGRFITDDLGKIASARAAFAHQHALAYLHGMQKLGYAREQALDFLANADPLTANNAAEDSRKSNES